MLKSICYRSTIKKELTILETESLFDLCKNNNDKNSIRGVLYKCHNSFFQIIEGESNKIDALFSKIKADKIHKNIEEIINIPIKEFTFKGFNTGYCKVDHLDTLYGLQEYNSYLEKNNFPNRQVFLEIMQNLFSLEL